MAKNMEIKIVLSEEGESKVLYDDSSITLVCPENSHLACEGAIKLALGLIEKSKHLNK